MIRKFSTRAAMLAAQNQPSNTNHQQQKPFSSSPTSMTSSDEPLSCSSSAPPSSASSSASSSSLVAHPPSSLQPSTVSDESQLFGRFNNLSRPETIPEGVEMEINYDSSGEAMDMSSEPSDADDESDGKYNKSKSKKQNNNRGKISESKGDKKKKNKNKKEKVVETQLNPEYQEPSPLATVDRLQQQPDILAMSHGGVVSSDPSAGSNGFRRQEERRGRFGQTNPAFTNDEDKIVSCGEVTGSDERREGGNHDSGRNGLDCEEEQTDEVLATIGTFGRWQRNVAIICSLFGFPFAWHLMAAPFFTPGADHWCSKPKEFPFFNWTDEQWKNYAIPQDNQGFFEICEMYDYGVLADPFTVDPDHYNSSYHLADDVGTRKIACTHWDFNRTAFGRTIEEQWSLVCSRSQLATMMQVTYILGLMVGSMVFGHIGDRVGRKTVALVAISQLVICSLLICLCKDLSLFLVLRFLVAMGCQGLVLSAFIIVLEVIGHRARSIVAMVLAIPLSLGTMSVAGIAQGVSEWTHMQLALSAPGLLLLGLFCFFPESPRWLLATGKSRQANSLLRRISSSNQLGTKGPTDEPLPTAADTEEAKKLEHEIMSAYIARHLRHASLASSHIDVHPNNMTIRSTATMLSTRRGTVTGCSVAPLQGVCPNCAHSDALVKFEAAGYEAATLPMTAVGPVGGNPADLHQVAASAALDFSLLKIGGRKGSLLDLFRTPYMRKTTFILTFTFFANGFAYYGLMFGTGNFVKQDIFLTILAGGLVEIPACLLAIPLLLKAGRRLPFCIGSVIAGVACVMAAFITDGLFPQQWPATSLKLFARSVTAACLAIIRLSSAELYPTTVRATGAGVTWGLGLLGGACALSLDFLKGYAHPLIRFILIGSMSISAGISALLMPETTGGRMFDTLADVPSGCKSASQVVEESKMEQQKPHPDTSNC